MGGLVDTAGGFLGLSGGPQAPNGQFGNKSLGNLADYATAGSNSPTNNWMLQYGQGQANANDVLSNIQNDQNLSGAQQAGLMDNLATGSTTGSKFAADQLAQNSTQNGLYGQQGQLGQAESKLTDLNNQGFNLTQGDQTMYGQMAGNIARQFGQQGNQLANSLASRGLSASGAAGAQFSGLAGNQNEQLANAQQQIAQQRFSNTMNQIGQYQNFVSGLGNQYNNALNQQYGRQLAGAQNQRQGLASSADAQNQANNDQNSYGMAAANFAQENKPGNLFDMAIGAANSAAGAGGKSVGQGAGNATSNGLFGSKAAPPGSSSAGAAALV